MLLRRLVLSLTLIALALATTASAVHWPLFGGDPGRSGNQPASGVGTPIDLVYAKTDASEARVVTSPATTAGEAAEQRLAFGTASGRVHLQLLGSGGPVGPEDGRAVSSDADAFTGNGGSVGLAAASTDSGAAQVYSLHNEDTAATPVIGGGNDIAVAQIDAANGDLVQERIVEGTNGYTVSSSPVLSSPDSDGDRALFFVAGDGADERLFRVPIDRAHQRNASFSAATSVAVDDANTLASPTLVHLNDADGDATPYIAVATTSGASLRTFEMADLDPGPASEALGGAARTASVPVTSGGETPGAPGSGVSRAPAVYLATGSGGATTVHRLAQSGNSQTLSKEASSGGLAGDPAPALAVSALSSSSGVGSGHVVLTTARNLHLLDAGSLAPTGRLSPGDNLATGTTGFSRTTAAVSSGLAFVTRDNGEQLVIDISRAASVSSSAFAQSSANNGSATAYGQPAVSRGFVQFASDRGVFVYRARCGAAIGGTTVAGTQAGDAIVGTAGDDPALDGAGGDDCIRGEGGGDTLAGGSGNDDLDGGGGLDTLSGGAGPDSLKGGLDRDLITGDSGNDDLDGQAGSNIMDGGSGHDELDGGELSDSLNGGAEDDNISGGSGNDGITGASGNDRLSGGAGDDRIEGGLGQDLIDGGDGGDNIVSIDGAPDRVECGPGFDVVRADGGDQIASDCERVIARAGRFASSYAPRPSVDRTPNDAGNGANGGQVITGSASAAQDLRGTGGNDAIDSPVASDRLFGLGGLDLLSGNSGNDTIDGGDATDVMSGGPGDDSMLGGPARDFLEGGPGNDRLDGQEGSNILNGSQGNDVVTGGGSVDSLNGGSDEDTIFGRGGGDGITGASGNDSLFGEDGADRIEGGLGTDRISGGAGGDNIVAADGIRDVITCGTGRDTVRADAEDVVARDCEVVIERVGDRYLVTRR